MPKVIIQRSFATFASQWKKTGISSWRNGMNNLETHSPPSVLATDVRFTDDALQVSLSDGREISVPLEWFIRLRNATPEQRNKWRFLAGGVGIHWEEIDEDIAVTSLLRV
jgi:hypothetical protein